MLVLFSVSNYFCFSFLFLLLFFVLYFYSYSYSYYSLLFFVCSILNGCFYSILFIFYFAFYFIVVSFVSFCFTPFLFLGYGNSLIASLLGRFFTRRCLRLSDILLAYITGMSSRGVSSNISCHI